MLVASGEIFQRSLVSLVITILPVYFAIYYISNFVLALADSVDDRGDFLISKYPPAEPGALVCEPLEAALRGR